MTNILQRYATSPHARRPRSIEATRFCFLGLWLALATPSFATFSGLTIIPTADTMPRGGYSFEAQIDGTTHHLRDDTRLINTQFGLTDRLEAGVDFDASRGAVSHVFLNAKFLLLARDGTPVRLAVGTIGEAEHARHTPYLVATGDGKILRVHAGAMRIAGRNRVMVGVDHALGKRLLLCADYTAGSDQYASVGVSYQLTKNVGLLAGLEFPNAGGDTRFSLHFTVSGP